MDKDLQEKFNDLIAWSGILKLTVQDDIAQMEKALNGDIKLPENCPSREALAATIFRDIEEILSDIEDCVEAIKKALRK